MKKLIGIFMLLSLFLNNSCSKGTDPSTDTSTSSAVPYVAVNISINTGNLLYKSLETVGGTLTLTGGYRGILLYRKDANTIVAYDRTCTYNITDGNGVVQVQNNGTAICLDCSSTYNLYNGSVNSGYSTIGLKAYTTTFNASTGAVTVTN
ncbi:MAG: hypothetical protein ABI199_08700 [Bacteroidia bacterium]